MSNPYTIRPVTASDYFVPTRGGCGAQAYRILRNIGRANPLPDSVSIVGERRFGKTSLLGYLQLTTTNTPNLLVIGVDMLSLNPQSPDGFYAMLTESLIEAGGLPVDHPTLSYQSFRGFLTKLRRLGQRLILFMDEFDLVARDHRFDLSFFDNLRSAATTLPLAFVVASVMPLAEIAHKEVYGSPFFNIFREERLVQLSLQEANALISLPPGSEKGLGEVAEEVIMLAGYHPYFLQLACRCAWDLREEDGGKLDMTKVRSAFMTAAHNQCQYIWDHCSSDEQKILCSLASGIRSERPELETLIKRGYVIDRETSQICGEGLTNFIKMQCTSTTSVLLNNPLCGETRLDASSTLLQPIRVNTVSPKNRLALVIGVDHYLHQQNGQYFLPPLKYAERDAKEITTLLTKIDFRVHRLLGTEATYDTVKRAFAEMNRITAGDPHPEGCFIFHFSGHSQMDPSDDETAYLVLYDTDPGNPAMTGFKMTHLVYDFLKLVQVPNALVLLDTCHAGFAAGVKHVRPASRLPNVTQQLFAGLRGRMVLAACAGGSQAREKDSLEHGVFTYYVLKHWRDLDGYHPPHCINFGSLIDYVGSMIPQDHPELPLPVYSGVGAGGTFILRVI